MAIFQFFLPPENLIKVFFFIKINKTFTTLNFVTLSPNWKVKNFTTSLIKSWSYQFLSLIDLKGIKKFIIASAFFLALKAREHFDCWLH